MIHPAGRILEISEHNRNLTAYSDSFEQWTKTLVVIAADALADPWGGNRADKIIADAADNCRVQINANVATGQSYVWSVYIKAGSVAWCRLYLSGTRFPGNPRAWFNLATGGVGTNVAVDAVGIEDMGDGWYRCWIAMTADLTGSNVFSFYITDGDNVVTVTAGQFIYGWRSQLEAGTSPSEAEPTDVLAGAYTNVRVVGGDLRPRHYQGGILEAGGTRYPIVQNANEWIRTEGDASGVAPGSACLAVPGVRHVP